MKKNNKLSQSDITMRRFLSLASFRDTHSSLMQNHHAHGNTPAFFREVVEFIQAGQELGELLDTSDERWAAQSLLDYWATVLFRADYDAPDVTLAEFNLDLAPSLDKEPCPYRGLDAFQEEDQKMYFGRQELVNKLLEKLQGNRLLAVVGPSGSGKSSLVRAGILPRLKAGGLPGSEEWKYYPPIVPGSNPLETLVATFHPRKPDREQWIKKQVKSLLENPDHLSRLVAELGLDVPTVFVIDQFEEIFTLCTEDACRQAFVNNLVGLIRAPDYKQIVIITMRRDFLERIPQLPQLQPFFNSSIEHLMPLLPEELREVIEEPANLIGLKYQDGVVDALIGGVRDDDAALPLLQFILLRLWDNKTRNRITMDAYQGLGGAHEALQKSADDLYGKLSTENKDAAKYIFVRLSRRPDKGQEVTRDRLLLRNLYEDGIARDRIDRVIKMLVDAHLVRLTKGDTEEDTLIEIAHEALIRNWPKLADWLYEDRDNIRRRTRLTEAAERWDAMSRDPSSLWRGLQLEEALNYKGLNLIEVEFIETSQTTIKAELERENARRIELETARIKAEYESQNAEMERENGKKLTQLVRERESALAEAQRQARLAFSRELAAAAINSLTVDPERSILLSIHAVQLTNLMNEGIAPEAQDALHRAVQASRVVRTLSGHTDQVRGIAFSPDGRFLASGSQDGTIKFWEMRSGKEIHTLSFHTDGVLDVAFSGDGKWFASASRDKTAVLWRADTREVKGVFKHDKGIFKVVFSPNNRFLATASEDETAKLWDIESGKIVRIFTEHTDAVNSLGFSPDGLRLATASKDGTVKIWDVQSGEIVDKLVEHDGEVIDIAFSPNGEFLVTAGLDYTKLWNNRVPREFLTNLSGHSSWVESVAFSKDSKFLATGSEDGTARVTEFTELAITAKTITLAGHSSRVYRVAFSPDNKVLATACRDGEIKIWDLSPLSHEVLTIPAHKEGATAAIFSPDGTKIISTSLDKSIKKWDFRSGELLGSFVGHLDAVMDAEFTHDGNILASAGFDKKVLIWDANNCSLQSSLPVFDDRAIDIAYSLDGRLLATASLDGFARVWDTTTQVQVCEFKHPKPVYSVAFRPPDGKIIATAGEDRVIRIWDVDSAQELQSIRGHIGGIRGVVYSNDGSRLATCSYDKTAKIIDASNGEVLHTLLGHSDSILDITFSPDDKYVATASDDRTIKIWMVETGEELLTLSGNNDRVRGVMFSPDGRYLVSAGQDGTLRVYTHSLEELLALAKARVTRSLRMDECLKYLHTPECPSNLINLSGAEKINAYWLVVRGKNLARGGDIAGAISSFHKAIAVDKTAVNFNPETEAKKLASYALEQEIVA